MSGRVYFVWICSVSLLTLLVWFLRHLNWTLKSLKLDYDCDEEQLPLKGFVPELKFPHSHLELLLEGKQGSLALFLTHTHRVNYLLSILSCYLFMQLPFSLCRWPSSLTKPAADYMSHFTKNCAAGELLWFRLMAFIRSTLSIQQIFSLCVIYVCPVFEGDLSGYLWLSDGQHMHYSLPPAGVLPLARLVLMGAAYS